MTGVPIRVQGDGATGVVSDLAVALEGVTSLEGALRWAASETPRRDIEEIVTQDEYTHDVVMRWRDDWYLVFDVT